MDDTLSPGSPRAEEARLVVCVEVLDRSTLLLIPNCKVIQVARGSQIRLLGRDEISSLRLGAGIEVVNSHRQAKVSPVQRSKTSILPLRVVSHSNL